MRPGTAARGRGCSFPRSPRRHRSAFVCDSSNGRGSHARGPRGAPPPPPEGGRFPRRLPPTPTLSRGAFLNVSGVSFVTPSRFSPNKMTSSRHPFRGPQGGEAQEGAAGPLRRRPPGARDTVLVLRARGTLGGQRVSAPAEARVLVGAGAGGRGRGLHDAAPRRAGKR